jgi:hypothetical protein
LNGIVTSKLYLNSIKKIEMLSQTNSSHALELIKLCDNSLVELSANKRQSLLNFLFDELFPRQHVCYDQEHYYFYMLNTIESNKLSFDPFKITKQMFDQNILINQNISSLLIEQLINSKQIKTALLCLLNQLQQQQQQQQLEKQFVDLNKLEKEANSLKESELNATILGQLEKLDKNNSKLYMNLLNPLLKYYLRTKENYSLANKLFEFIKSNEKAQLNYIVGNISLAKYACAFEHLNNNKNNFSIQSLLSIYSILNDDNKIDQLQEDVELLDQAISSALNSCQIDKIHSIKTYIQTRIPFINCIQELCQRGIINFFFYKKNSI